MSLLVAALIAVAAIAAMGGLGNQLKKTFGNVQTNITPEVLAEAGAGPGDTLDFHHGNRFAVLGCLDRRHVARRSATDHHHIKLLRHENPSLS